MKETFNPNIEKQENEYVEVVLEFMRHGEKKNDPNTPNINLPLTEKGEQMAVDKGFELSPDKNISIAFGSSAPRTRKTSALILFPEDFDPNESLEDMEEKMARQVGKQIGIKDIRLDFNISGPIKDELLAAFKEGKYISFLVNESDKLAMEKQDSVSTTYIRQAANIAEIIARYSKVTDNLYKMKSERNEDDELTNKLERYLSTHQSICETFIAKCLEKVKGISTRDEFVRNVGSGFGELQGMNVTIKRDKDNKKILITYPFQEKQETLEIDDNLLREIIEEREEYEKKFE